MFLKFINFKLFLNEGLKYPLNETNSNILKNLPIEKIAPKHADDTDKYQISEEFKAVFEESESKNQGKLFDKCVFYLNREVPRTSLEFVILSFGGQVYWEGDESEMDENDSKITHFVTDRDPKFLKMMKGR